MTTTEPVWLYMTIWALIGGLSLTTSDSTGYKDALHWREGF